MYQRPTNLVISGAPARRWRLAASLAACALAIGCGRPEDLGPVANLTKAANIREVLVKGAEGAGGEVAATGTGWATVKGQFTYAAEAPEMPPYGVNKDQAVCAPGGQAPPQEFLLVDKSTKGIANIVIYPRRVARVHESAQPTDESLVFDQKECVFLTHVMPFTIGQPMSIKNSDSVGHNTNIEGQGANKVNQTIPAGGSVPYTAKKEEAAPIYVRCSIHPWMLAYMLPRANAYFAVTAEDGTFEIPNLPAGELLEIQFWHESAAGSNHSLVIDSAEAKELKWDKKGRVKITLEPDETREIKIVVPPSSFSLP
jgi:plastocyanin